MFCQLDQVKEILDIAEAVRGALRAEYPANRNLQDCGKAASTAIFALLVVKDYDVFPQQGEVSRQGDVYPHHWVELYLDGEAFVLDVTYGQFCSGSGEVPEVIFLPADEAAEEYGYGAGKELSWQREACSQDVWQRLSQQLQLQVSVVELLDEVDQLAL